MLFDNLRLGVLFFGECKSVAVLGSGEEEIPTPDPRAAILLRSPKKRTPNRRLTL